MENTISGFLQTFNSGDISLISAIIYDNPDQINENFRSVGLPVGANEMEIMQILKAESPNLTEKQFYDFLNVPFVASPFTSSLYPVLLSQAGIYNPGTTQSDSIRWGIFREGIKLAFNKHFKNSKPKSVTDIQATEMPTMVGIPTQNNDGDLKLIRKMRLKTAIIWSVLAILLIIITIKTFRKK
jgi:hypothetical protein